MTTFVLSDETINSYDFRVATDKLHLHRFMANPVMLYNHDELVGRWENIRIEGKQLLGDASFMDDQAEQMALKVSARVDKGFVRGASIGIHILRSVRDENDVITAEAEVYECSVCDVPANANAVRLYDSQGEALSGEAFKLALNTITEKKNTDMNKHQLTAENMTALSLQPNASEQEVNAAVQAQAKENAALKIRLENIEKQKVETLITTALNEGRFLADKKAEFEKLATLDFNLAKQMIAALPKKKTLKVQFSTEPTGEDRDIWTFTEWRQKDPGGLLAIKKDDQERYLSIIGR